MENIFYVISRLCSKFAPLPLSLGIEISSNSIKTALVKQDSHGSASLIDYEITQVNNKDNAPIIFKEILKSKGISSSVNVKFVVSGADVDSKRAKLSSMPEEEIAAALRWQAKEHFLFNIDESMLDFEVLRLAEKQDGSGGVEVIANIAKNEIIDSRISLLKNTGIVPSVIIPVAYGLRNIYNISNMQDGDNPVAIIDIGADTTTIVIIKDKNIRFIRQISCAGGDCTKAMSGAFVSGKGRIELSPEKAEAFKKEFGIPNCSEGELKDGVSAAQIASMLRPVLEKLGNNIRRSFDYYISQFQEENISKIYISGGTSSMKNIESQLFKMLSVPVEKLNVPKSIKLKIPKEKVKNLNDDFAFIAPAIGAALHNIEGLNLIPLIYKKDKIRKIEKISARLAFIFIVMLLSVFYLFNLGHEGVLVKILNAQRPQWQKLQEVRELHARITQKNAIMNQTLKRQIPLYYLFKALANAIPREIYLRDLSIEEQATSMSMEGIVVETSELAEITLSKFIKSLEDSIFFHDVLLGSTQDVEISGRQALEFKISCGLGRG